MRERQLVTGAILCSIFLPGLVQGQQREPQRESMGTRIEVAERDPNGTRGQGPREGSAWGGSGRRLESGRRPLVGGLPDEAHPEACALVGRRVRCAEGVTQFVCTAVLVAPRLALTAAHCFKLFGPRPQAYELAFGADLTHATRFVLVADLAVHPNYDERTHENDVAVLVLAEPAPVAPATALAGPLGQEDVGLDVTAVGFGLQDPRDPSSWGTKSSGTMRITRVTQGLFETEPAPSMTCQGDSGGPVYLDRGDGPKLVGLTASGDPGCADRATNVRLDALWDDFVSPWITESKDAATGWPEDALALSDLCDSPCGSTAPCPALLECVSGPTGSGQCRLPGALPGNFEAGCADDSDCGPTGQCVRVWSSGSGACRCLTPCQGTPVVPDGGMEADASGPGLQPPGPARGCACSSSGGGTVVFFVLMVATLSVWRRLRGRGRTLLWGRVRRRRPQ